MPAGLFGAGKRLDELEARLDELERRLAARERVIDGLEGVLRAQLDEFERRLSVSPEERTRLLLNSLVGELRTALTKALEDARRLHELHEQGSATAAALEARARGQSFTAARLNLELNRTHRAEHTGYLAVYVLPSYYGPQPRVNLLVGSSDPPRECVAEISSKSYYAGSVVRRGEYWRAEQAEPEPEPSIGCVFTPFG